MGVVMVAAVALAAGVLMVLTAVGAHRRGAGVAVVVASGLFFPITWTAWYLRDERPYQRTPRRTRAERA